MREMKISVSIHIYYSLNSYLNCILSSLNTHVNTFKGVNLELKRNFKSSKIINMQNFLEQKNDGRLQLQQQKSISSKGTKELK